MQFLRGQLKQISGYSTHSDTFVPLLETASKSPDSVVADESSLSEEEHQLTTIKRQGESADGKPRVFEVFETKVDKVDFTI
uniref:Uncharacterized protein n=1 Tax=Plectus sambesii TaxID=2011161 RepID=A0A914UTF4_9BILA